MEKITITLKEKGKNEKQKIYEVLCDFVMQNFDMLVHGAYRSDNHNIVVVEEDYYAPVRVQVNKTRLHPRFGVKYCDGIKYSDTGSPLLKEENIINAISDIQSLIDEYSKDIYCSFELVIKKKD